MWVRHPNFRSLYTGVLLSRLYKVYPTTTTFASLGREIFGRVGELTGYVVLYLSLFLVLGNYLIVMARCIQEMFYSTTVCRPWAGVLACCLVFFSNQIRDLHKIAFLSIVRFNTQNRVLNNTQLYLRIIFSVIMLTHNLHTFLLSYRRNIHPYFHFHSQCCHHRHRPPPVYDQNFHDGSSRRHTVVGLPPIQRGSGLGARRDVTSWDDDVCHFLDCLHVHVCHEWAKDLPGHDVCHERTITLFAIALLGHTCHTHRVCLCFHRHLRQGGEVVMDTWVHGTRGCTCNWSLHTQQ